MFQHLFFELCFFTIRIYVSWMLLNPEYSCVYFFTRLTCFLEVSDDLIKNLEDCKKNGKHERQYKNTIGALTRSPVASWTQTPSFPQDGVESRKK